MDIKQVISACKEIKAWSNDYINLLINNVGTAIKFGGDLKHLQYDTWDKTINLNLRAPFAFTKELSSSLINASKTPCKYNGNIYDGSVINISSVMSTDASYPQGCIAYSVAKAGVNQLTRLNAHELAKYKVRVNSVQLASVVSDVFINKGWSKEDSDKVIASMAKKHIIGRNGTYKDVIEMVQFLAANDKSGWITGANMDLNGGWSLYGSGTKSSLFSNL